MFLKSYKVCAKLSVSSQLHDNPDWSVRTNANQLDDVAVIELLHYVWRKKIHERTLIQWPIII